MEHIKSPKFILLFLGILAVTAIVIVALVLKPYHEPKQQFSAMGEGKALVAPDIALVRVGFSTQPKASAADAVKESTFTMNRILAVIAEGGVASEDVKTTNYMLTPQYEFPDGRQRLLGYVASQEVQLKIRNLDKAGDVIAAATAAGANQVSDIQFTLEDDDAPKAEARAQAIEKAKERAQASAAAAGLKLGKLLNMYENEPPYPGPYFADGKGGGGVGGSVPLSQGIYEVVSQVTLVYEVK